MSINDGGPAFPATVDGMQKSIQVGSDTFQVSGMTLRDYFAAKAMMGMMSCQDFINEMIASSGLMDRDSVRKEIARFAYAQADAMIDARTVQP